MSKHNICTNHKISVIVPAYNVEKYLQKCLDSIVNQSYSNLEIIVIDDGSTDSTAKIISEYSKIDARIVPIYQVNKGLVETRNIGIETATGEYVTFVDGDDEIQLDMYERLLNNALKYNADISHCGINFCFMNGTIESHYNTGTIKIQDNEMGQIDLLKGEVIEPSLCNKLYKKFLLEDSCLDKKVINNEDLLRNYVAFKRAQKSVYEDFCGYQYYQYEKSMSNDRENLIKTTKFIIRARNIIKEDSEGKVKKYAVRSWLSSIVNAINQLQFIPTSEAREQIKYYQNILKKERKNLSCLILRQRIAAYGIIICPRAHMLIYNFYRKWL